MLSFDPTTSASLNQAVSQLDWCSRLVAAWGATRRAVVKTFASAGAPWSEGTVIRDYDLTGTVSTSGAQISEIGIASNARVKLPANLATANARIRISNAAQTQWVEGTYGLSGTDFISDNNPSATSGDAITATIRPYSLMPSGVGPASPPWTSSTPKKVRAVGYATGSPVVLGDFVFTTRDADFVFEHPDVAGEKGDAAIWLCENSLTYGQMEFAPMLVRSAASNTRSGTQPHERVLIGMRPVGWNATVDEPIGYPSSRTYGATIGVNEASPTISTYIPAIKFIILNDADQPIVNWEGKSAIEMHDGLPVNDPSLVQDEGYNPATGGPGAGPKWGDVGAVVRPHVNCAMVPQWQNEPVSRSVVAPTKWFNGMTGPALDPSAAKRQISVNGANRLFSLQDPNGIANMWVMPKWPRDKSAYRDSPIDPYMADPTSGTAPNNHVAMGWGHEPGAIGGHDWYTARGGPRFNRSAIPSVIAMHYSQPSGARLEGNVPWDDMADAWLNNMFNWSHHYIGDPRTFTPAIPKAEQIAAQWTVTMNYYGPSGSTLRAVPTVGYGNGGDKNGKRDASGRPVWGWYLYESYLHGYNHAGIGAWLYNSHAHAILQRHSFDAWSMNMLNDREPAEPPLNFWGQRKHAWRMFAYFITWICGSKHRLGYSRAEVESRLRAELMTAHELVWRPTYEANDQAITFDGIRKLGQVGGIKTAGTGQEAIYGNGDGGGLFYYMGHVMQMWKVTGFFDLVKSWGIEYERVLDLIIYCLSKPAIDWIIATNGRMRSNVMSLPKTTGSIFTAADIPASFAELNAIYPSTGSANWYRDEAGLATTEAEGAVLHLQSQWCQILKDFFPEYHAQYPNLDAAIAIYQGFYAERKAIIDGKATAAEKGAAGWYHLVPSHGMLAALVEE